MIGGHALLSMKAWTSLLLDVQVFVNLPNLRRFKKILILGIREYACGQNFFKP
jgi:hypothetical protein